MNLTFSAAIAAAGVALLSTQALAGTTVKVEESGEGGSAMAIKIDQAKVPAGKVTFVVTNAAVTEEHEMVLVKLNSPDQELSVDTAKHRIDESTLEALGEVADLKPSDTSELNVNLKPGTYVLLCNIKGHYEAGMSTKLTVTEKTAAN